MTPVNVRLNNRITISAAPEALTEALIKTLTLPNPKWLENERMGRWNRGTPKDLKYYRRLKGGGLRIPRGFMGQLLRRCRKLGVACEVVDQRRELPAVNWRFQGRLKPFQQKAVADLQRKEFGTLSAPTGSGKTVMGLYLIAQPQAIRSR